MNTHCTWYTRKLVMKDLCIISYDVILTNCCLFSLGVQQCFSASFLRPWDGEHCGWQRNCQQSTWESKSCNSPRTSCSGYLSWVRQQKVSMLYIYLNLFFSLSSAQKVWVSKKINSNKIKSFFAFTYRTDEISNRVKSYIWQTAPGISNSHNIIFEKKIDMKVSFNPLHPNISMHILHTVLYTFHKVLRRRICLTIRTFFSWWSFPVFFLL